MPNSVSGHVYENGAPVARVVRAYDHDLGVMIGESTSDPTTGAYTIATPGATLVYVIALDDENLPDFNAQIVDRVGTAPAIRRQQLLPKTKQNISTFFHSQADRLAFSTMTGRRFVNTNGFLPSTIVGGDTGPTLREIFLSSQNFIANAPIGTNIGQITVTMFPVGATFTGTLTVDDTANFRITFGNLETNRLLTAGQYPINITATQSGAIGSPLTVPFTIIGTSAQQTISSVGLDGTTFVPTGAGAVTVGNVNVVMSPVTPASTATITLGGTDAASFQLTNGGVLPCVLQAKSTTTTLRTYQVTLTATQSGISNSPLTSAVITLTATAAATLPSFVIQNSSATLDQASGYVSVGHMFATGDLLPSDSLKGTISGSDVYMQKDVLATHPDGSVRHAVLSFISPAITHNASGTAGVTCALSKSSATAPSPVAPSASALAASGYDITVAFRFYKGDGTTVAVNVSALTALNAAIAGANGGITNRLAGAAVNEFSFYTLVNPSLPTAQASTLRLWFNIRAYAGGKTMTDIEFDLRWHQTLKNPLIYDVTISKTGITTWSNSRKIAHYLFSIWHHQVWDPGLPDWGASYVANGNLPLQCNIQYNFDYLRRTGVILKTYDPSLGVTSSMYENPYAQFTSTTRHPLDSSFVTTGIQSPSGRVDIGPITGWAAWWLFTMHAHAHAIVMDVADAGGAIPWNWIDEGTLKPINIETYHGYPTNPNIAMGSFGCSLSWSSAGGGTGTLVSTSSAYGFGAVGQVNLLQIHDCTIAAYNGDWIGTITVSNGQGGGTITFPMPTNPGGTATGYVDINRNTWVTDHEHEPELSAHPYWTTGSKYYLDILQGNAGDKFGYQPWGNTNNGLQPGAGGVPLRMFSVGSTRGIAWGVRDMALATYLTPDADPIKSYFNSQLDVNFVGGIQLWITDNYFGTSAGVNSFTHDSYKDQMVVWNNNFAGCIFALVADMGLTSTSTRAQQILDWTESFHAGMFLNGTEGPINSGDTTPASVGFNPLVAATYVQWWTDSIKYGGGGVNFATWAAMYDRVIDPNWRPGVGGFPARNIYQPIMYTNAVGYDITYQSGAMLGYPQCARAHIANIITNNFNAKLAIEAWLYLIGRIRKAYDHEVALGVSQTEDANEKQYQMFQMAPILPNGVQLDVATRCKINSSDAASVSLTADAGLDQALVLSGRSTAQTATITGNNATYNFMYGPYGICTFNCGNAATHAFSGPGCTGAQRFNDGAGANYFKNGFNAAAGTFDFSVVATGTTEVANFRHGTDKFSVKQNLNGNGKNTAADIAALFDTTTISGSTRVALGTGNKVVIFRGVTNMTSSDVLMHA